MAPATKGEYATKIGVGAGVGAAIGGVLGGTDGAAKGAGIGGGAGTAVVLATKRKEIRLGPGADVSSQFDGAADDTSAHQLMPLEPQDTSPAARGFRSWPATGCGDVPPVHSGTVHPCRILYTAFVALFAQLPPRTYVECPRCGSLGAFITLVGFETQCSFCPLCQNLWDTRRPRQPDMRPVR